VIKEVDEGQPCLLCGERCPGFALHVWRYALQTYAIYCVRIVGLFLI